MSPPLELESVEYLECLVRCNRAVSDCLNMPLDSDNGAEKYEKASEALANPAKWPNDAATKAVNYVNEFPELLNIFENRKPGGRCPIWEQVARDLMKSEKFLNKLAQRLHSWAHARRARSHQPRSNNPMAEIEDEFGYVAWQIVRIIIGKAEYLLDRVRKGLPEGQTWLDDAMLFGKRAMTGDVSGIETGKVASRRDETIATADPVQEPPSKGSPRTKNHTDLDRHEDENRLDRSPGTDESEQPAAMAEDEERDSRLKDMLALLLPGEQQVIQLKCWEGLTWEEIATAMGCSVAQAKKHWESAKKKLRQRLPDDFHE